MTKLDPPKLLCDAMLAHVGRRLRSAGYDTWIDAGKLPDDEVLKLAIDSNRLLLTCDVGIERNPRGAKILFLAESSEEKWAKKLSEEIGVNWMLAPFTRCLDCNTELIRATEEQNKKIPENIKQYGPPGLYCQSCDKLYWEGTHTERMRARLEKLNQA